MSENNAWSAPNANDLWGSAAGPVAETAAAPPPRKRTRLIAIVAAVVVGLVGIGAVAYLVFGRDSGSASGASSPEGAVNGLADAINADDTLAALQFIAPDEVEGVSEALQAALDAAKAQGVDGSPGGDADLTVSVSGVKATELADHAARVSFDVGGDVLTTAGLAAFAGTGGSTDTFDVDVIAVELDGGWFLSPMLTLGDHLVDEFDLPSGDYARIGQKPKGAAAGSAEEAVQQLLDAAADRDLDRLTAVLSSGEARTATVFADAIDELLDDANSALDDEGATIELDDVQLSDLGDGRIGVDGLTVTVTSFDNDPVSVEIDGDCGTVDSGGDRNKGCLFDNAPFTAPLADQQLVLDTTKEDGGFRVDLVRSGADLATELIKVVDIQQFMQDRGLPQLGTPQPLEFDVDQTVTFSGEATQMFEVPIPAGSSPDVTVDGDDDLWPGWVMWVKDSDGRWVDYYDLDEVSEDTVARVIVGVDCADYDDNAVLFTCKSREEGDVTIRVTG